MSRLRSWSPLALTPVGTLARGGGGAHRPLSAASVRSQSSRGMSGERGSLTQGLLWTLGLQ